MISGTVPGGIGCPLHGRQLSQLTLLPPAAELHHPVTLAKWGVQMLLRLMMFQGPGLVCHLMSFVRQLGAEAVHVLD